MNLIKRLALRVLGNKSVKVMNVDNLTKVVNIIVTIAEFRWAIGGDLARAVANRQLSDLRITYTHDTETVRFLVTHQLDAPEPCLYVMVRCEDAAVMAMLADCLRQPGSIFCASDIKSDEDSVRCMIKGLSSEAAQQYVQMLYDAQERAAAVKAEQSSSDED